MSVSAARGSPAGEAWFAGKLVDYDPGRNEGNWQWVAGTGIDAQPWFRILNPERQRLRFDADGELDLATEAGEVKERYRAASR